jgi:hypothetical protein
VSSPVRVTRKQILVLLLAIAGLACNPMAGRPGGSENPMHSLHIALHEGFQGQTVTIRIDGKEVYKKAATTNLAISRADAFDVQVAADKVRIEISIEPGAYRESTEIDVTQHPFVAVSLAPGGGISFQPSKEFFRYM